MYVLATATGDIWGVSDPIFLVAYLVVAAGVWVAGTRARRAIADRRPGLPAGDLTARPHDVALLNGGPDLAVYSALTSMHLDGTIVLAGRGEVRAGRAPEAGADALERAIHFDAAGPVPRHRLRFHRPVTTVLREIEARLVKSGLLLSVDDRHRIRRVGRWLLAVAGLGLVRLLVGFADARPVGLLLAAVAAVLAVAVFQLLRAPRRSRLGDETLARLQDEHHALSPTLKPDWTVHGPADAALGVGVFGMGALWASDPAFADELAAQKSVAATSAGSGGDGGTSRAGGSGGDGGFFGTFGWGDGGGGGGWGDGSGGGGGSSCGGGGGGGCGGGGGGG